MGTDLSRGGAPSENGWLVRAVERLSGICGALASICLALTMALICVEIVLRNAFNRSTMVSDEMSGYLFAGIVFLGLGKTLRDRGFIRVEVIYSRLRGPILYAVRWAIVGLSIVYIAVLQADALRQVVYLYSTNVRSDGLSETPLYIPESLMLIGWCVLLLQLLTYVIRRMRDLP